MVEFTLEIVQNDPLTAWLLNVIVKRPLILSNDRSLTNQNDGLSNQNFYVRLVDEKKNKDNNSVLAGRPSSSLLRNRSVLGSEERREVYR